MILTMVKFQYAGSPANSKNTYAPRFNLAFTLLSRVYREIGR
jgi:hypothetical protein